MRRPDRKTEAHNQRKAALMAFTQALNRLQWEKDLMQDRLAPQLRARKRSWIRTWSLHTESGTLIRTIPAHAGAALTCAVSPECDMPLKLNPFIIKVC